MVTVTLGFAICPGWGWQHRYEGPEQLPPPLVCESSNALAETCPEHFAW